MNLTSFLGWRLKPLGGPVRHWGARSTYNTLPSLEVLQGRASVLLLLHKPKWVAAVEREQSRQERTSLSGDLAPLCSCVCEISLIYTFCLESPYKTPKGIYISCVARKQHHICLWMSIHCWSGHVYDVFHASLTSDFLVWGFLSPVFVASSLTYGDPFQYSLFKL